VVNDNAWKLIGGILAIHHLAIILKSLGSGSFEQLFVAH
jgi:hypothetical protein